MGQLIKNGGQSLEAHLTLAASSRCIIPKYVCFHLQLSKSVLENIAYTDDPDELVACTRSPILRFRRFKRRGLQQSQHEGLSLPNHR